MGANSSIRAHNEQLLNRISSEENLYLEKGFWKTLFETVSPYLEIPDLSQIILKQKLNVLNICQLSFEFLESAWLQVEELSPNLIRSSENSLNFLSFIIPVTIEHSLFEFFWSNKMGAYRVLKAAIGLYTSLFFGASGGQLLSIHQFKALNLIENSQICNKRREMVLKLLVSCLLSKDYAYKLLLTRDIFISEEFLVALLESLFAKSPELVHLTCKCLNLLLENEEATQRKGEDIEFVKDLLKQRKKLNNNIVQQFFVSLSDENINKVLNSILQASATLLHSDKIGSILNLLSILFSLNENYCKYIAVNKNISVVSSILLSQQSLSIRSITPNYSKVFYLLSHYREFSVSLTTTEMNLLLEFMFKIVLAAHYEFEDFYPLLTGTFCNISPYILELSSTNSNLITLIIEYLTEKAWLLRKKSNHLNIFYMIQGINSLIQYQWEGCPYLIFNITKKKESFYKIIRMQVDTPEEACLDDKDTDGEIEEESFGESEDSDSKEDKEEEEEEENKKEDFENSSDEVYSEREDRVIELEKISEGLVYALNVAGPDEVVQRTSYLNTHVSAFEEDADRRNTVQQMDIHKEEEDEQQEWKPTPEWMLVWKSRLPIKCIFVVVKEMFSIVLDLQEKGVKVEEVFERIKRSTLVGVLPRPHSIFYV